MSVSGSGSGSGDYTEDFDEGDDVESKFEDDESTQSKIPEGSRALDLDTSVEVSSFSLVEEESSLQVQEDPGSQRHVTNVQVGDDDEASRFSSVRTETIAGQTSDTQQVNSGDNDKEPESQTPSLPSASTSFKPNSEIDDIMRKLEKLEKAQTMLETFMNHEGEGEQSHSHNTSVASNSLGISDYTSYSKEFSTSHKSAPDTEDEISKALSAEMDSLRKLITDNEVGGGDATSKRDPVSQGDRSVDELLKEYEMLEREMETGKQEEDHSSASVASSLNSRSLNKANAKSKKSPYEKGSGGDGGPVPSKINKIDPLVTLPPKAPKASTATSASILPLEKERGSSAKYNERVKLLGAEKSASTSSIEPHKSGTLSKEPATARADSLSKDLMPLSTRKAIQIYGKQSSSHTAPSSRSMKQDLSGGSGDNSKSSGSATSKGLGQSNELDKLRQEIFKQETLIEAYQKENEGLCAELKKVKERLWTKDEEHSGEVNRLKTEIATLKLNRLAPASPRLAQRAEVERLNSELSIKSEQIIELHRELAHLKIQNARPRSTTPKGKKETKQAKAVAMSQEKENDYQRNIRGLQKQVRTLQKILYHKDPTSVPPPGLGTKDDLDPGPFETQQTSLLESRIADLENELTKADLDCREKLKDFQNKLTGLKSKYEDRIRDLESKLNEAESSAKPPELSILEDTSARLERSQSEVTHLKSEISRLKRELEIAAKSSASTSTSQLTARQDASTLSLAIKSFKSELAEKEKELLRTKKEVADLKKTNMTLKREREKYLSTNANFSLGNRVSARASENRPLKNNNLPEATKDLGTRPFTTGPTLNRGNAAYQLLQSTLETERAEFEALLADRNKVIREREKQVSDLRSKLELVGRDSALDMKGPLAEELRSRLVAQIKISTALKDHLASCNGELTSLRKEKGILEFRIRELSQELTLAKTLSKPENEILSDLTEKVESLNSRYFYREKQLDSLLSRLAVKNSSSIPPSLLSLGLLSNGHHDPYASIGPLNSKTSTTLAGLDLARLSPTTVMLLEDDPDLFLN